MLKSKITKAEYDALPDALKAVYKQDGDNYLLQSDGADELRRAKDREKERADNLEREIAAINERITKAEKDAADAQRLADEQKARDNKDITALETSWQQKLDAAKLEHQTEVGRLTSMLENTLLDSAAQVIASEISTVPELLTPVIRARLRVELNGDKPITRVLTIDGQPSAANLDDLKKEFVANDKFASIIKGSNASGGGASNGGSGGGAAGKKISEMTEAERVATYRANPDAYKQQAKAEGLPVYG